MICKYINNKPVYITYNTPENIEYLYAIDNNYYTSTFLPNNNFEFFIQIEKTSVTHKYKLSLILCNNNVSQNIIKLFINNIRNMFKLYRRNENGDIDTDIYYSNNIYKIGNIYSFDDFIEYEY